MRINSAERAKGSLAMFVSRGLVDPKVVPNRKPPKGKLVNIPAPRAFCHIIRLWDIGSTGDNVFASIIWWRIVMMRSRRKLVSPPMGIS